MSRQVLVESIAGEKHFQWRGGDTTRLEFLSDAVFAFAITLLVVALEVPRSFHELLEVLHGFVAFGVCFAMLALIWFYHCRYFRRYGLDGPWVTFLNCVLLFVVLFYIYPLKFLVSVVLMGAEQVSSDDYRTIFVIYGCGFGAVFATFALMYWHAWHRREALALDEIERARTCHNLANHLAMAATGLGSALLALVLPERLIGWAGYFYTMIAVSFVATRLFFGRQERQLIQSHAPSAAD